MLKRLFAFVCVILAALSFLMNVERVSAQSEPIITIMHPVSLGPTDRWHVTVEYPDGSPTEDFYIEGTKSESATLSFQSTSSSFVQSAGALQQDILMGFSYTWSYQLEILGTVIDVLEFNLELAMPIQVQMEYHRPMVAGVSYPVYATLTPLDLADFNEFSCDFNLLGMPIIDVSQSFTTPLGLENALTFELGPFWFWAGIPFGLFSLDVGLVVVPQLFSEHVDALIGVVGDAVLQSAEHLVWNAPAQTVQFSVLAKDASALDFASISLSEFRFVFDRLLIGFNAALQFNWIWGGSSLWGFELLTVDAGSLLPELMVGVHPNSPASQVQADVPVIDRLNVVPEVPFGTIMSAASMFIALAFFTIAPKLKGDKKRTPKAHARQRTLLP